MAALTSQLGITGGTNKARAKWASLCPSEGYFSLILTPSGAADTNACSLHREEVSGQMK